MQSMIEDIRLKIDNGGDDLTYEDLQYLLDKLKKAKATISRISMISNTINDNESSVRCALATIKDLTSDFLGGRNGS